MYKLKITGILIPALLIGSCGTKQPVSNPPVDTIDTKTVIKQDNQADKTILFFGDSLTAGLGLDDLSEAFPGVIKARIDSLKLPYRIVNSGVSGETSAGGLNRIDWVLKQKVNIFLLELGANDGLRGIPTSETTANLQGIINRVKANYPEAKIILLGMQMPPNMGADYTHHFKAIYPALAAKNHLLLVPFLLTGVGGKPELNQRDGIHPTATGAEIMANNVWRVLKPLLY